MPAGRGSLAASTSPPPRTACSSTSSSAVRRTSRSTTTVRSTGSWSPKTSRRTAAAASYSASPATVTFSVIRVTSCGPNPAAARIVSTFSYAVRACAAMSPVTVILPTASSNAAEVWPEVQAASPSARPRQNVKPSYGNQRKEGGLMACGVTGGPCLYRRRPAPP